MRTYVTCALCGGRRRMDATRVRTITAPETFEREGQAITIDPPAHVCESHFRVREFIARTEPSR